jgi:transcriptional regulator with GAF, ATPase, and Fis domain
VVDRVRLIGQVLANALHRQRVETALHAAVADLEQTREALQLRLEEIREFKDRLEAENVYLRTEIQHDRGFGAIVGQSRAMLDVLAKVSQVAPTTSAVLLLGETGTGKELLAHAIHDHSPRRSGPLVKVSCAALPPTLIESELFGHEKGAFTGATAGKAGRFELADGGTLFLDEIGELTPEIQVKLLRVLQDGQFERVGSTRTRTVRARIVAATNRDLGRAMAEGHFREDLYFRLSVFPIQVPPLRERREDIPILVWAFIDRRQTELGRHIERIPARAMAALRAYAWPGNVRELENVIERALILSTGSTLRLAETPGALGRGAAGPPPSERLDDLERTHIRRVVEGCGWRIHGKGNAAEQLGLHPNTLRSRMQKLGITRPVRPA